MNLTAGSYEIQPSLTRAVQGNFLSFRLGFCNLVLSRVFYSAFLPEQSKITCAEKRLFPLDRREGNSPQNRNSIRDSRTFLAPWVLTFWPLISLLIINSLSGSPVLTLGIKITTVFLLGLETLASKSKEVTQCT